MCIKIGYRSAREAWRVVRRKHRREQGRDRRPHLGAYRCPFCGEWHLKTTTDRTERRATGKRRYQEDRDGNEFGT